MAQSSFVITQGNLLPLLKVVLKDGNGDAVDVSGATSWRFHLRPRTGTTTTVDAAATLIDDGTVALRGRVDYEWQAGDTDDVGVYLAEFEVTWAGSKPQTFPHDKVVVTIPEKLA